jgi:hypothetical protein
MQQIGAKRAWLAPPRQPLLHLSNEELDNNMTYMPPAILPVTITNGTSLSTAAQIGVAQLVGIELPTMTSAALSFQASSDGVTWRELFNSDGTTATSVAASTGDRFVQAPAALAGVPWVKVRSGTSGSPVNQGADRTINVIAK